MLYEVFSLCSIQLNDCKFKLGGVLKEDVIDYFYVPEQICIEGTQKAMNKTSLSDS
jgi:hypothetical protein